MADGDQAQAPPPKKPEGKRDEKSLEQVFMLEDAFLSAGEIFAPKRPSPAGSKDVLVSFDTNALLIPYLAGKQSLQAIENALDTFAVDERLFIPARAVREFARHRGPKIAELINALNTVKSKVPDADPLHMVLQRVDGYEELEQRYDELKAARSAYIKSLGKMVDAVIAWRGDDPVSQIYRRIFVNDRIVEHDGSKETVLAEWRKRSNAKVPPGYKDAAKDDEGIGDYLIWLAVLKMGATHRKDMLFVTGETKPDWAVRLNIKPLSIRPELQAEYAASSGGCNIRILMLHELLEELHAPEEVVNVVAGIEAQSSTASIRTSEEPKATLAATTKSSEVGTETFDYSTRNGSLTIGAPPRMFVIGFSKGSREAIHIYRDDIATRRIARLKSISGATPFEIEAFDTTSRSYTLQSGEHFFVENMHGYRLVGRVSDIMDDARGDDHDSVTVTYVIFGPEEALTTP